MVLGMIGLAVLGGAVAVFLSEGKLRHVFYYGVGAPVIILSTAQAGISTAQKVELKGENQFLQGENQTLFDRNQSLEDNRGELLDQKIKLNNELETALEEVQRKQIKAAGFEYEANILKDKLMENSPSVVPPDEEAL